MSITERLEALLRDRRLYERRSSYLDISSRGIYLRPEIHAIACRPFADTDEGERHAALAAFLDAFCELGEITVCQRPRRKPSDVMLARLCPVQADFWAMRITDPSETPGIRLLGAFCGADMFVGLGCYLREEMDFKAEVEEVRQRWKDLFGDLPPHTGDKLDDYISNYIEQ